MVDPALGVLEYAMKRKGKDLRGALASAKEVLDRAKPEDGEGGTEVRNTVNFWYFDPEIVADIDVWLPRKLRYCDIAVGVLERAVGQQFGSNGGKRERTR